MRHKLLQAAPDGGRTFALVFDAGDEAAAGLAAFCRREGVAAAHFTAIGAFSGCVLGYFELDRKDYKRIPVREQVEVVSLVGDVALLDGEPKVHAHVVVAKSDGTAVGGHLLEARVRPTLEVVLEESPAALRRTPNPEFGLALIDLDA